MSPPAPDQQDAALAALTGTVTEQRPDTDLARNMLRLRLVMEAKHKGVPWAAIGQALGGISAKAAKREMKALARETQRELLAGPRVRKPPPRRRKPERRYVTVIQDESTVFTAGRE